ncbi:hypothetical protein Taro_022426 [Colocasia esculenta]|uniref:Uncharacterized protein n=1 Tax=Colocasia esculenta TaxID=4460 RepID=A0A843VBA2_COLES|nr:hypothetical protein [Colocasia esculenta]
MKIGSSALAEGRESYLRPQAPLGIFTNCKEHLAFSQPERYYNPLAPKQVFFSFQSICHAKYELYVGQ